MLCSRTSWFTRYTHTHTHTHTHQFVCVSVLSHIQLFCDPMDYGLPGSSVMEFSKQECKNTGVGCHFLLQKIFPIPGWNPRLLNLLHWQRDSLPLVPRGKARHTSLRLLIPNSQSLPLPLLFPWQPPMYSLQ